jgi:hypothetical protein
VRSYASSGLGATNSHPRPQREPQLTLLERRLIVRTCEMNTVGEIIPHPRPDSRLYPPRKLRRVKPQLTIYPNGRQLTGADPIPERNRMETEYLGNFVDVEQAGASL